MLSSSLRGTGRSTLWSNSWDDGVTSTMKTVTIPATEAAQLLLDSGLLGEINRVILHPRGLALSVQVDDNDRAVGFAGLLDYRDDPSGIWFDAEFRRELAAKLAAYDAQHPLKDIAAGIANMPVYKKE